MQETTHCSKCGMRFKADRLDRNGLCKSCVGVGHEGEDRNDQKAGSEPKMKSGGRVPKNGSESINCPKCAVEVDPSRPHCPSCLTELKVGEGKEGQVEYHSAEAALLRREARSHLKRLLLVRRLVGTHAGLLWVVLLLFVLGGLRDREMPAPAVDMAVYIVQLALVTHLFIGLASIHARIRAQLLIVASLYTVSALAEYQSTSGFRLGFTAVVYWFGLLALNDIHRLRELSPGAFDEDRRESGRRANSAAGRAAARRTQARRRGWRIAGVCAFVLVLGAAGIFVWTAKPSPDATIEGFQAAWNRSSKEDVASFAIPGKREKWVQRLERRGEKYGWDGELPKLDEFTSDDMSTGAGWVSLSGPDGTLRAAFILHENTWVLRSLDYSGFE